MNPYTQQIKPIFLLGAGRSGTKFLRDILSASNNIIEIPYDIGYVWRYGNENIPHDELLPENLTNQIITYIHDTIPKLTNKKAQKPDAKYILEKSVPNTLRPLFLYNIFPNAKFIHLIRDGREVTESSIRMWRKPPERSYLLKKIRYFPWSNYRYAFWYALNIFKGLFSKNRGQTVWGPRYKGIEQDASNLPLETVCAKQWRKCVETSIDQLKHIPKESIFEIRYENLIKDSKSIRSICEFLDLNDTDDVINKFEQTVIRTETHKWKSSLSPSQLENIHNEINKLNTTLGYS